jgi:hypothetical protein
MGEKRRKPEKELKEELLYQNALFGYVEKVIRFCLLIRLMFFKVIWLRKGLQIISILHLYTLVILIHN